MRIREAPLTLADLIPLPVHWLPNDAAAVDDDAEPNDHGDGNTYTAESATVEALRAGHHEWPNRYISLHPWWWSGREMHSQRSKVHHTGCHRRKQRKQPKVMGEAEGASA